MAFEWKLDTPKTKTFVVVHRATVPKDVPGVGEDGELSIEQVTEEIEQISEESADAAVVRISALANDKKLRQFHIRLVYGRVDANGVFGASIRDDGIIISGPEYGALDTNADGIISEDEVLSMSAKILRWDGELVETTTLPVEGPA